MRRPQETIDQGRTKLPQKRGSCRIIATARGVQIRISGVNREALRDPAPQLRPAGVPLPTEGVGLHEAISPRRYSHAFS
jgi:hypothetical protein